MMRCTRRGQATAEFAIVFLVFALVMFGLIEVGRALYEKQALARAAETMVQTLAQADPPSTPDSASVASAIAVANRNAALNLSTSWSASTITSGYYNAGSQTCATSGGDLNQPCEFAANADGHVIIIGLPDLNTPTQLVVSVTVPYRSYIGYPLQFLGGQAKETVVATTRCGQYPEQAGCVQ